MTSREQKIWDTVHAWAKHQNPGIPEFNLRALMDDVLGVVESEVEADRRRVWDEITSTKENRDWYTDLSPSAVTRLKSVIRVDVEPTEKRTPNAAPRLDDPAE